MSNSEGGYNPLDSFSSIDKQLEKRQQTEEQKRLLREEIEDYRKVANAIFSTPNGLYLLNKLKRACAINSFDNKLNPAKLVEDNGRRAVWFELIQPHVDKSILRETEQ